ncbi:MAG: NADH-quinone oxidoreductase subunit I [SAR324 cluster bacterium]|nr:NADH-quinone oxidoreductase subunit I [SAR324 cluster bacterium]
MKVKVVTRDVGFLGKFYLPAVLMGLWLVSRHFFANLLFNKMTVTINYPEVKRPIAKRWRGRHRLTRHENGFIKCVACFLCEEICPANCIHIKSAEMPFDKSVEKYPSVFDIDELRCIFCGLCVEACPKDAIRMDTEIVSLAFTDRKKFDYTRNLLLDEAPDNKHTKYTNVPLPTSIEEALPNSKGVVADDLTN